VEGRLAMEDGECRLTNGFLSAAEAAALYQRLVATVPWQQEQMAMYGRMVEVPRLTAWVGDPGTVYQYSGIRSEPEPWSDELDALRARVGDGARFNSVLLNYYRDGDDSVAWHSDDEPELGENPVIASLSLGAVRTFRLRHKRRRDLPTIDLELQPGSLLLTRGGTQHCWEHCVPKRALSKVPGGRINLTFRWVGVGGDSPADRRGDR